MARRGENIRKRKDGRWEGRYTYRVEGEDKSRVRSVYAKSYNEVRKKLSEAKQPAEEPAKQKTEGKNILFVDVAAEWLSYVAETKKYSTYVKYKQVYDKYLSDFFHGQKLGSITAETVESRIFPDILEKFQVEELSGSLKKSICCIINRILSYASKKYHITVGPIRLEQQKTSKKPIQVFLVPEQQKLMDFLGRNMDLYKFGILLCLYTGLRLGELCALKWTDVDLENRVIYVTSTVQRLPVPNPVPGGPKTVLIETEPKSFCSRREIPICDALYPLFLEILHQEKYVIGGNRPADPRTYQKKYASYLAAAGVDYRCFHTLRHTFASNCAACGADTKALSEILGHSNVQITLNRYVHPSMQLKRGYLNLLHAGFSGQNVGQGE